MTLATLRRADPSKRRSTLASAANFLLPTLSDNKGEVEDQELVSAVFGEMSKRISVNRDETFKTVLLQRMLAKEIRDNILGDSKISDVRARVGQMGLLGSGQYDISFRAQFLDLNVSMGVSKEIAKNAIVNPIRVEHLFPERQGLLNLDAHTLFTGSVPGRTDCGVIVLTIRRDATLYVDGAWLVFFEDVGVDPRETPVEVLKALALTYGVEITAGETKSKFILLASSPVAAHETDLLKIEEQGHLVDFRTSFSASFGKINIALAFALNLRQYISDLQRHGINVTRKLPEQLAPLPPQSTYHSSFKE